MNERLNSNPIKLQASKKVYKIKIIRTKRVRIYPTDDQQTTLLNWIDSFKEMFNATNTFIKTKMMNEDNTVPKISVIKAKKFLNFQEIRRKQYDIKQTLIKNDVKVHMLDDALKHCVAKYKTCLANFKAGHCKNFTISDWDVDKRSEILIIETSFFSKTKINGFCLKDLGEMKSSSSLLGIKNTSTLVFDRYKGTWFIMIPREVDGYTTIKPKVPKAKSTKQSTNNKKSTSNNKATSNKKATSNNKSATIKPTPPNVRSKLQRAKKKTTAKKATASKKKATASKKKATASKKKATASKKKATASKKKATASKKKATASKKKTGSKGSLKTATSTKKKTPVKSSKEKPKVKAASKLEINQCGIDPGMSQFLTIYSPNKMYEVCGGKHKKFIEIFKQIDRLKRRYKSERRSRKCKRTLSEATFKRALLKRNDYLHNMVTDMHWKVAKMLCVEFDKIVIGKFSTKQAISNEGDLPAYVKRVLVALRHYGFREKLQMQAEKYKCTVIEANEYKTTMTCSNCGHEQSMGKNKVYDCESCELKMGRDDNAARNIFGKY
jgi:transposase